VAEYIAAAPDPVEPLRALEPGAAIVEVETALRAIAAETSGLDPLARASLREAVIRELRKVGVTSPAALADAALGPGPSTSDPGQGGALELEDPEPWPEPVDGDALLSDIADLVRRYVVAPEGAAEIVALWVTHSYRMDLWDHTPYLAIVSATPRCGKSSLTRIVGEIACRVVRADGISASALFRVIEAASPTLTIDELDRVPRDSDVWPILNSGHSRGGSVVKCHGDEHTVHAFPTFAPKVLTYIRSNAAVVPASVEDRCLRIQLQRRRRTDRCERLRSRDLAIAAEPIRRQLRRWTDDARESLSRARPAIPDALDDRAADGWEPLLAVADVAGGRWPTLARRLALSFSADRSEDECDENQVLVLLDLLALLDDGKLQPDSLGLAGEAMVRALCELPDRPWATLGRRGDGLTTHRLGRLLKDHGIRPVRTRRARRYDPGAIREAALRYTPPGDASGQSVIASQPYLDTLQVVEPSGRDAMTLSMRHRGGGDGSEEEVIP
jgi:putative DNA primase/helicase